ncbi:MAG: zinc-dependent metalloprotease family protein, partial [Rubripirellula sp.]
MSASRRKTASEKRRSNRRRVFEKLEDRRLFAIGPDNLFSGAGLSTYRLALATTVEFTEEACDVSSVCDNSTATESEQRAVASDALDEIVEQVNEVFRQELSFEFQLIPDNDLLISTGSTSLDGYTDFNTQSLLNENPLVIESRLSNTGAGESNEYDIGHVLALNTSGGLADLGSVGQANRAHGTSGVTFPLIVEDNVMVGSDSLLGVLMHEIGHQFNA